MSQGPGKRYRNQRVTSRGQYCCSGYMEGSDSGDIAMLADVGVVIFDAEFRTLVISFMSSRV